MGGALLELDERQRREKRWRGGQQVPISCFMPDEAAKPGDGATKKSSSPDDTSGVAAFDPLAPTMIFSRPVMPVISTEKIGDSIGRYKLLAELGVGGFGIVWRAEQHEPIHREVALKVIKPGMDSREIIARFEAERQALALMDHPNIAGVLDAGATDNGRPYFVMELVKGVPITDYCDEHKLTIRQRLELFIPVCQAVQHAHQKAILHRDLKPSNILIAEMDGKAVPKVIDFGIAKALGTSAEAALQATLARTVEGMVVGTPQYMSPEQAGSGPDMDTRSDIYTLGVILYELLVGNTPLPREQLKKAAFDEVFRLIREAEPVRPSSCVIPITNLVRETSIARGTEPGKLTRALRGDLDWITLKALEKDRERRYESAAAFAQDIERHLKNEPVEAGPPSAIYRLRKLVQRNRLAFGAAAAILVLLIAGIGVSTWQAVRAIRAEKLANQRLADVQEAQAKTKQALEDVKASERKATLNAELAVKSEQAAREQAQRATNAEKLAMTRLDEANRQAALAQERLEEMLQAERQTVKAVVRQASTSLILLFQDWDILNFRGQQLKTHWQNYWQHIKDLSSFKEADVTIALAEHIAFLTSQGHIDQRRLTEQIPLHISQYKKNKTSPPFSEADDFCKKLKSN